MDPHIFLKIGRFRCTVLERQRMWKVEEKGYPPEPRITALTQAYRVTLLI
jgi:hypothetical protein